MCLEMACVDVAMMYGNWDFDHLSRLKIKPTRKKGKAEKGKGKKFKLKNIRNKRAPHSLSIILKTP